MSEKTMSKLALLFIVVVTVGTFAWTNLVTFIAPPTEAQIWAACYHDSPWAMTQCMNREADRAILAFIIALTMDFGLVAVLVWGASRWLKPASWLIQRWTQIARAYLQVRLRLTGP